MMVLLPTSIAQVAATLIAVAISVLLLAVADSVRRKMRAAKLLAPVPGPEGRFLLGYIPEFMKNLDRIPHFQVEVMNKYGGRTKFPWNIFSNNMLFLADPADVEHVLSKNVNNWIKSDHFIASVNELFGKSLFGTNHAHTADGGARYRVLRKVLTRVFTTNNFKKFTEGIFRKYAMTLIDVIKQQGGKCDMHIVSSQFTLQTTFDITCGVSLQSFDDGLGTKFIENMDYVFASVPLRFLIRPYFRYFWWCMPSEYKLKRASKVIVELVDSILEQRVRESEEELAPRADVLSMLIKKARELEGEDSSIVDIPTLRANIASLIFGGRDTTSTTITFAFYALAQYPAEQDKILEELKGFDTNAMSYEDVKNLKYLDAFVWETLRLYPAVPSNVKQAAEDDVLPDGTFIPAGTDIVYTPYYMGRNNAALWGDDQLVFRPERWLEMKKRPSAYEFPVFQAGPRICMGMNMALLEAKLFIAIMLREFHVKIQDGEQLENRPYSFGPTLSMVGGLPLQLTPRASVAVAAAAAAS